MVGLVCVGTDAETSRQAVALVDQVRTAVAGAATAVPAGFGAWATVGLHPHDASQGLAEVEQVLDEALAEHPGRGGGGGECGLDYHYDHSPRPAQREMFAAQVALAKRPDLTLVVHTRAGVGRHLRHPDAAASDRTVMVMHCFTGGPDEARRCLDLDAFLSFSGIVTFKNADDVRAAAALCPLDRLLVETDAPFLAPVPHRGEDNRPALVSVVGAAVAAVKTVSPAALAASSRAATVWPSPCPAVTRRTRPKRARFDRSTASPRFADALAEKEEKFVSSRMLTVVELSLGTWGFPGVFHKPAAATSVGVVTASSRSATWSSSITIGAFRYLFFRARSPSDRICRRGNGSPSFDAVPDAVDLSAEEGWSSEDTKRRGVAADSTTGALSCSGCGAAPPAGDPGSSIASIDR